MESPMYDYNARREKLKAAGFVVFSLVICLGILWGIQKASAQSFQGSIYENANGFFTPDPDGWYYFFEADETFLFNFFGGDLVEGLNCTPGFAYPSILDNGVCSGNELSTFFARSFDNTVLYYFDNLTEANNCFNGGTPNFSVCDAGAVAVEGWNYTAPPPQVAGIWGSAGIFGSTSMLAAVTTGAVATGAKVWPLFAIVGVPVAFFLAFLLIQFIISSVGARRRREIEHFDFEKADNLKEFYTRDGGIDPEIKKKALKNSQ